MRAVRSQKYLPVSKPSRQEAICEVVQKCVQDKKMSIGRISVFKSTRAGSSPQPLFAHVETYLTSWQATRTSTPAYQHGGQCLGQDLADVPYACLHELPLPKLYQRVCGAKD